MVNKDSKIKENQQLPLFDLREAVKLEEWPIYFKDQLIVGDIESNVGVATLWTEKELFKNHLHSKDYAAIGPLFSKDGINAMIRNVYANPNIQYLIVCGKDKTESGKNLLELSKTKSDFHKKFSFLEKEIPEEALKLFFQKVKIIDLIGEIDPRNIEKKIKTLDLGLKPFGEAKLFEAAESIKPEEFPSDPVVYKVRAEKVKDAWLEILKVILRLGVVRKSHYSDSQKEVLSLAAVIDEDPYNPDLADYFTFTKKNLAEYEPQVLTAKKIPGTYYTYGQRLMDLEGFDQIKEGIVRRLVKEPFTRRAVAVTWHFKKDAFNEHCPCLDLIQALVQKNKLYFLSYIRSNDMFKAWPQNAFALRKLQAEIVKKINKQGNHKLKLGSLTTISASAHLYEEDWKKAEDLIKKHRKKLQCEFDSRGNFVIRVKGEMINVTHYSPGGVKIGSYQGKTAMEVFNQLDNDYAVSQYGHAFDLGAELQKAELALKYDLKYTQDRRLILDKYEDEQKT